MLLSVCLHAIYFYGYFTGMTMMPLQSVTTESVETTTEVDAATTSAADSDSTTVTDDVASVALYSPTQTGKYSREQIGKNREFTSKNLVKILKLTNKKCKWEKTVR